MKIARRGLLGASMGALALAAGCSSLSGVLQGATTDVAVTLENAQAEARAILAALQAAGQSALASGVVKGGAAATLTTSLAELASAVNAFSSISSGATVGSLAQGVISAVQGILGLLPIDPAASAAISLGLSLVSGLIGGATSITVPMGATSPSPAPQAAPGLLTPNAVGPTGIPPAPIAIPMPKVTGA